MNKTIEEIEQMIYKHLDSLPYEGGYPYNWQGTLAKYIHSQFQQEQKQGAVWVRASERLPDESWKGKMRNITIDGTWHYEDNVPYKMIKGLLNHELDLQHEWLDETHIPEKGSEEVVEQNGCTCYYFNKFERKANSTCPVHNAKHQQAEQTNPVSDEEIEAMAKKEINEDSFLSMIESFSFQDLITYGLGAYIKGAKAIRDKAALQTSAGWSDDSLLGLVKHVFIEAQKGGGYTKETGETLLKQYKQSQE